MARKTKYLLVQLGSPRSPQVGDVRRYLKEFLLDPRLIDLPRFIWRIILYLFILPFRPQKSARAYARIWDGKEFPLIKYTRNFAQKLNAKFLPVDEVDYAFVLSSPRIKDVLSKWQTEGAERASHWVIIPQFPQYCEGTTASVMDQFFKSIQGEAQIPSFEFVTSFHRDASFIQGSLRHIHEHLKLNPQTQALIISFHGIPVRRVTIKKDPYYRHCLETFILLKEGIENFPSDKIFLSFQSRFGSEEWLGPATDDKALELVKKGEKNLAVYCPSFTADCLETIDEIGHELREAVLEAGGDLTLIPCLNDEDTWCDDYARFLKSYSEGFNKTQEINLKKKVEEMPKLEQKSDEALGPETKKTLKLIFFILFLDLIGFSIVFPLFPAMARHYLEVDPENFFLKIIFKTSQSMSSAGLSSSGSLVLFGGVLGALYSLCQFIATPFWGNLSDKIGRRKVFLISITGLTFSYLLWFFSGSFTILIFSRLIGGIMAGNISTATAAVADVTSEKNRTKGMAMIGIAFALGFILGPALGGLSSLIRLDMLFPESLVFGINPFSTPALISFVLCLLNLILVAKYFKETLPTEKRGVVLYKRSNNLFKILKPLPFKGVNLTSYSNFIFLIIFSGAEFSLTFLAVERLGFTPAQNGMIFVFVGFILALVQGGFVRRKAHSIGEKKLTLVGFLFMIPAFILIGFAQSKLLLYSGLFFMACGSAIIIPCLTSLTSLYAPSEHQGKSFGVFRALGALARVLGPLLASIVYGKWGSGSPYFIGCVLILVPLYLVSKLPKVEKNI
ncbi:MAG: ferrochelatase [Bacteriovoracaceae bacterium]|nr:ferrochelatase [Bacteriovoracaceae bacterium]